MTTACEDDAGEPIPGRAAGYVALPGGRLRNADPADTSYKVPGGGLLATASDVSRFGTALLEARLVGRPTLAAMLTPQKTRDGRTHGYGLGLTIRAGPPREAWHTGGQQGASTVMFLRPDSGVVVVVLTNLEEAPSRIEAARRIAEIVER
jgi:CubicO group peptidase (beta-lactamase class C family)